MTLSSEHQQILELFETYKAEYATLTEKNVKAAASRTRKALSEISKLCKSQRANISESVKKMPTKGGGSTKKPKVAKVAKK